MWRRPAVAGAAAAACSLRFALHITVGGENEIVDGEAALPAGATASPRTPDSDADRVSAYLPTYSIAQGREGRRGKSASSTTRASCLGARQSG